MKITIIWGVIFFTAMGCSTTDSGTTDSLDVNVVPSSEADTETGTAGASSVELNTDPALWDSPAEFPPAKECNVTKVWHVDHLDEGISKVFPISGTENVLLETYEFNLYFVGSDGVPQKVFDRRSYLMENGFGDPREYIIEDAGPAPIIRPDRAEFWIDRPSEIEDVISYNVFQSDGSSVVPLTLPQYPDKINNPYREYRFLSGQQELLAIDSVQETYPREVLGYTIVDRQGNEVRTVNLTENIKAIINSERKSPSLISKDGTSKTVISDLGIARIHLHEDDRSWTYPQSEVLAAAASTDGEQLMVSTESGFFMLEKGALLGKVHETEQSSISVGISPSGEYGFYSFHIVDAPYLHVLRNGNVHFSVIHSYDYLFDAEVSSNGDQLLGCGDDEGRRAVLLLDKDGNLLSRITVPSGDTSIYPAIESLVDNELFSVLDSEGVSVYRITDRDPNCEPRVLSVQPAPNR